MYSDELLDIVDINDQVIGQEYRSKIYDENLSCFRVINAFLINSQNQLWIPLRCADKKLFPLCLDVSAGGHVSAGETYEQAFERELYEELNISAPKSYKMVAKMTPHLHFFSAFMQVYIIYTDETPNFNRNDFISGEWISLTDLHKKIRLGAKAKPDLVPLINLLKTII